MPLLVSSGPGAPTPTPRISAPGTSRLVWAMVRSARATSRSTTARLRLRPAWARCRARGGPSRPRRRCRRPGWSRRYQSPVRIARRRLHARDADHRGGDSLHRQAPPCIDGAPAGRPWARARSTDGRRARRCTTASRGPFGPKPNSGTVGPNMPDHRRADRGREVQRSGIVGDQHRRPLEQRGRRPQARSPAALCTRCRRGRGDPAASGASSRPADHHYRDVERRRELGVVRPPLGTPDGTGRQRHEPRRHSPLAHPPFRGRAFSGRETEPHPRRALRPHAGERKEAIRPPGLCADVPPGWYM